MFKCTLCNQEYETKPQYCDCGNDTFEEVLVEPLKQVRQETTVKTEKEFIPKENIKFNSGDIVSYSIFFICIILSILSLIFLGNSKNIENSIKTELKAENVTTEIPSINKLWDDTPVKAVSQPKSQPKSELQVSTPKPSVKNTTSKKVSTPVKKQTTEVKKTVTKPVAQSVTKTPVKQQVPVKPTTQPVQQTKTENKVVTPVENVVQQPVAEVKKVDNTKELQEELSKYKVSLRNTIAKNIDFTKVIGDGSCEIRFSLNNSGRLINKSFTKQSQNTTLNDVVYQAMMTVVQFNPPPEYYKGENLKLKVGIFDGRFEVTLN